MHEAPLLAPRGTLHAAINLGNPLLARAGAGPGTAEGVSVDLARALAAQLRVPLALQVVETAAQAVAAVRSEAADLGFFAVDPQRGEGLRFSAPYLLIEGAYLVRSASPLQRNDEVDRPGMRVVVGQGSAYDLYLSRTLQHATLQRAPSSQAVVAEFLASGAEVAAGVKQPLQAEVERLGPAAGGLRLLPGRFMVIEQATGIPAGRGAAAQRVLHRFIEAAKAEGAVAAALRRHGVEGAGVAPPAAPSISAG
ncbi:transporter substrate-binding domain-containing protein [Rubrivivax rivuli]|uniref:Transporter substrate-binding domain-containing protein n=1 Tax=Rubrivivax rivuli TaxID=1862385 RepID=A0A437RR72_9BURK|nr:transporter substrate-binding domain-containing protein [Rubrivivax rivuli]RVU49287.1 transporter substrate-binding domain-containing protein [Rubrivivax rivuli]